MVTVNWNDIELNNIKGILLDLDNTLYDYEPTHQKAYEFCKLKALQDFNIAHEAFDSAWKKARNKVHEDLHGQGASHSRLLYFQKQHEYLFEFTNADYTLQMEAWYWDVFLDHLEWREGAKNFLEKAKGLGLKVCIVTDLTAAIQLKKWNKMGLHRYIQFLVSSEESGVEKPGKYIFELALEKLGLKTGEVIMIGDSEKKDIMGAEAIGITSYLITETTV